MTGASPEATGQDGRHEFQGRSDRYCEAVLPAGRCNLPDRDPIHAPPAGEGLADMLQRRGVITTDPAERAECCGLPRDEDGFCVHRPGHPIAPAALLAAQVRRQCAEELDDLRAAFMAHGQYAAADAVAVRIARWSGSGRTPDQWPLPPYIEPGAARDVTHRFTALPAPQLEPPTKD